MGRTKKHSKRHGGGGVDEKDWGTFFESFLRSGPYPALQKVANCKVEMKLVDPSNALMADEKEAETTTDLISSSVQDIETPVNIQLACQGVNFPRLSEAEKAYSALTVMDTYNLVDFDNKLSKLDFDWNDNNDGNADEIVNHAKLAGWMAGDCEVCQEFANNNRVYLRTNKIEPMEKVKKWTDMFEKAVTSGPYSALSGIHDCAITVVSDAATASENVVQGPAQNA